jgi:branched-chain amino acid transport system permease protein
MTRPGAIVLLLAMAAVLGFAWQANNYLLQVGTTLAMSVTLCYSWNFVGGFMGYPSFATASLFGIGVYGAGILQSLHWPVPASWAAGAATGCLLALLLGLVLLHLRGHYFAIGTIATVEVLREVANNWDWLTGGAIGLNVPMLAGSADDVGRVFYLSMWSLAAASMLTNWLVARSRFGVALRCIRQNEAAATMIGINVYATKVAAFVLSGGFAAGAGAIYASLVSFVQPDDAFNLITSIEIPVMVLLGGAGTLPGPLIGAVIYIVLNELVWARFINYHGAILGAVIVLVIYFLPRGTVGAATKLLRPGAFSRKAALAGPRR